MRTRPPTQVQVVEGLIRLERVRAEAYRTAAAGDGLGADIKVTARRFAEHSRIRADALRTQLEALGGGLDGPLALEPGTDPLAGARGEREVLAALARLERVAVDTGARALARLEVPELISTVASAMGGHAEQLAALRLALDEDAV